MAVNIVVIALLFPQFSNVNAVATRSVILVVPWIALLLLPSAMLAMLVYRSFVKNYGFTFSSNETGKSCLTIELFDKSGKSIWKKDFFVEEITESQIVDFEDNHYCNFRFSEKKYDLVIHRDSGDFQNFLNALAEFAPDVIRIPD